MKGAFFAVVLPVLTGVIGWSVGTVYPAPPQFVALIGPEAVMARARADLQYINLKAGQSAANDEKFAELRRQAAELAARAGSLIQVEHQTDQATADAERDVMPAHVPVMSTPPTPTVSPGTFEARLAACPGMTISNEPQIDATGYVAHYSPRVDVNGVELAVEPVTAGCLSSGFGERNGKLHKGIDFFDRGGSEIVAAGDGTIIEMKYRDDYGNMYLIDHGHGVYTRYAHLSAFAQGLTIGSKVHAGQPLGLMGNTAAYPIPVHLHFELLLGNYSNPKGSFGLTPVNIFSYEKVG
jgi:murein DD-endopeptidase MepM/ murein hydrolase activator NlpD